MDRCEGNPHSSSRGVVGTAQWLSPGPGTRQAPTYTPGFQHRFSGRQQRAWRVQRGTRRRARADAACVTGLSLAEMLATARLQQEHQGHCSFSL